MTDPLKMPEVARRVGLSYDVFRKRWPAMIAEEGFPAPFRKRPHVWRPEDLDAWQDRRVQELARLAGAKVTPLPASPRAGRPVDRVAADRARALELRRRA